MTDLRQYQGLPEAPVSLNFNASIRGYAVQLTLRGEDEANTLDRFDRLVDILESEYDVKAPGKPGELAFEATELVPNVNDGTVYWKIKGGRFQKWGVTVWPEVLEKAGFVVDELDPIKGRDLSGWVAVYILDEEKGHPKKVIELRQPGEVLPEIADTEKALGSLSRTEFFAKVRRELGFDGKTAGLILLDSGKYEGGFDANIGRIEEMWQDLANAKQTVFAAIA